MDVGMADASSPYPDQHIPVADLWRRQIEHFERLIYTNHAYSSHPGSLKYKFYPVQAPVFAGFLHKIRNNYSPGLKMMTV
jgi:hypothetical protein